VLTDDLLELQRLDTTSDQLAYRRAHAPERESARAATAALTEHRRRRTAAVSREQELDLRIEALERDGEQLTAQRTRLEAQLKTVIAPREAEALMHELTTVAQRRDGLDDQELASLEEQSQLVDDIAGLDAGLPAVEAAAREAGSALAAVEAEIDAELAAIAGSRSDLVARLYELLRSRFDGVAVARLDGTRCSGCHLDLAPTELAEVRGVGPGEFADCPQCGRLLVP
jgi:uncharacterized protein